MKKYYLLGLMGVCTMAFAQSPKIKPAPGTESTPATPTRTTDVVPPSPVRVNNNPSPFQEIYLGKNSRSQLIGRSMNDQQTNGSIYNRIHVFGDGKVSTTWTTSADGTPFAQRGSGYNHFDGTSWGPVNTNRIESERAGFPSYSYSAATNEEMIISHRVKAGTGEAGGIFLNRKALTGSTWTTNLVLDTNLTFPGVLWPKTVISGDYLHIFASYTDSSDNQPNRVIINGIRTPQVYSRYKISTSTWLDKNILLPGYDSTRVYAGGGDNYSIDAKDSIVVILLGGLTDDLALWKSTDNGSSWTKTIIDSFPVPAYDYKTLFDTTYSNDGAVHVVLDATAKAHCFWPLARVLDANITDNSVTYFPGQVNLMYWQEGWHVDSILSIATSVDVDNDGAVNFGSNWNAAGARYGNHSIITMPSAAVAPNGNIYVIYSSLTEKDVSADNTNYRDVYGIFSEDGGKSWSTAVNLTSWIGLSSEQVFGSIARTVNNKVHITYMQKTSVGRWSSTDNPNAVGPYDIYYMNADTSVFRTKTVTALNKVENDLFTSNQNFPNPFRYNTTLPVVLHNNTAVQVSIRNIVGQEVYSKNFGMLNKGLNELDINVPSLQSGVYFYEIQAGGFTSSGKMIVE